MISTSTTMLEYPRPQVGSPRGFGAAEQAAHTFTDRKATGSAA